MSSFCQDILFEWGFLELRRWSPCIYRLALVQRTPFLDFPDRSLADVQVLQEVVLFVLLEIPAAVYLPVYLLHLSFGQLYRLLGYLS